MSEDTQLPNNQVEYVSQRTNGLENDSSIKIRLDVSEVIQEIEFYLRGLEVNYYKDTDTNIVDSRVVPMGEKKLNDIGIKAILSKARAIINKAVVMGNLTYEQWLEQIKSIRIEFVMLLYINFHYWGVKWDYDIVEITDMCLNCIEPLLTRTIDNKEREGYSNISTSERVIHSEDKGGFKLRGR